MYQQSNLSQEALRELASKSQLGNTYNQKQLGMEWSTALMLRKINYQLMLICMLSKLMIIE